MAKVTTYTCPACMAPLRYDGETGKLVCDYCGRSYSPEEAESLFGAGAAAAAQTAPEPEREDEPGVVVYACPTCGAELICEESTAALRCPYCGNPSILPSRLEGVWKPELILPFKVSREEAERALKVHYMWKKLLPRSFSEDNHISEIQGVYVPFWLFDGEAWAEMDFEATRSHSRIRGDYRITTTEHFRLHRKGSVEFSGIPADASAAMPDPHMDSLEPFDYNELVPFSMSYLPGFMASRYDVPKSDCIPRVTPRAEQSVNDALKATCTGYETLLQTAGSTEIRALRARYALLPVWLLSTRWKDENFLFAINGQTGKLVGDLPVDMGMYWKQFGLTFAVVTAIVAALGYFWFL